MLHRNPQRAHFRAAHVLIWSVKLAALSVVAALVLALASWWLARMSASAAVDAGRLYAELRERLDPKFPGRGPTDYSGNTVEDVPKGYAMILKAELLHGRRRRSTTVSPLAVAAARFLMENSDERRDGFPGWGVPIAWDPYGDGSINPAHTKYTISTAIVVDALMDWIEADASAPRERVLGLIRGAFMPYLASEALSPSGLLPYSLEAVDRPYDTFNPAAYMAGVMQRYSRIEKDAALAARIRAVADKTVVAHLKYVQRTAQGAWYWHYSVNEKVPNDLAHAGYIIWGLKLYAEHGGALAGELDQRAIEKHLADFIDPDSGKLIAWPAFRKDANTPARSYDLGMGLFLVAQGGESKLVRAYLSSLLAYLRADGAYLKYPPKPGQKNLVVREYECYVLLGLASVQQREAR